MEGGKEKGSEKRIAKKSHFFVCLLVLVVPHIGIKFLFLRMGRQGDIPVTKVSRLSQCRESDLFVTRAKILIASEKLQGFVPNPARNLTAHKDRILHGRSRGEKVWGAEGLSASYIAPN